MEETKSIFAESCVCLYNCPDRTPIVKRRNTNAQSSLTPDPRDAYFMGFKGGCVSLSLNRAVLVLDTERVKGGSLRGPSTPISLIAKTGT